MSITIALAGNPNCGKTTMFNALTGAAQFVGNWPGVTVEKKEGGLKGHRDVTVMDLPGIYSLSPYTLEEVVARNYLIHDRPDVILNLVDASNIERNLYLTTQLLELGIPVVVALNMMDVVRKRGDKIDAGKLSATLGCPVVETTAVKGEGCMAAAEKAAALVPSKEPFSPRHSFAPPVEEALSAISGLVKDVVPAPSLRWYAIKLFERDEKVMAGFTLSADLAARLEGIISGCEEALDDDSESIITNERYTYLSRVMDHCVKKVRTGLSTSDKIDRIVTHRVFALPIFAAVMFCVYAIAMGSWPVSIGTKATDWTNDVLFAEIVPNFLNRFLLGADGAPVIAGWLYGLIQDGIVAGVGAVLGFGSWKPAVAVFTGLIAKENVVGTFGVLYQFAGELSENGDEIWGSIAGDFTGVTAYSFMIFNLLCAPCFAAMGAIKREMNSPKWTLGAIGYMCGFAYVISLMVYQLGGLLTGEVGFGTGTVAAILCLAALLYLLFRKGCQGDALRLRAVDALRA